MVSGQNGFEVLTEPLQFNLLCKKEDVYKHILKLKKEAEKNFRRVSKVFRLFNESCLVESAEDPLLDLKLMAQGVLLHEGHVVTIDPDTVIGFALELYDGKIAYIAFATYAEKFLFKNKRIPVPNSDNAMWSGIIYSSPGEGHGHRKSSFYDLLGLLYMADKMGIEVDIKNPYEEASLRRDSFSYRNN